MQEHSSYPVEGGCTCRTVRYRVLAPPLVVHCCHCTWCQRETGASFALNAMIESDLVLSLGHEPEIINTPTLSARGQSIARRPQCRVAVWSHYSGSGPITKFVRVGTLDTPDLCPPDVHIFVGSKQSWVVLSADTPAFDEYYDRATIWSASSLARF